MWQELTCASNFPHFLDQLFFFLLPVVGLQPVMMRDNGVKAEFFVVGWIAGA